MDLKLKEQKLKSAVSSLALDPSHAPSKSLFPFAKLQIHWALLFHSAAVRLRAGRPSCFFSEITQWENAEAGHLRSGNLACLTSACQPRKGGTPALSPACRLFNVCQFSFSLSLARAPAEEAANLRGISNAYRDQKIKDLQRNLQEAIKRIQQLEHENNQRQIQQLKRQKIAVPETSQTNYMFRVTCSGSKSEKSNYCDLTHNPAENDENLYSPKSRLDAQNEPRYQNMESGTKNQSFRVKQLRNKSLTRDFTFSHSCNVAPLQPVKLDQLNHK